MSTKSTILLTKDNEHWYRDGTEITLELSKRNVHVDLNDDEEIIITVTNPNSEIYQVLADLNNVSGSLQPLTVQRVDKLLRECSKDTWKAIQGDEHGWMEWWSDRNRLHLNSNNR